MKNYFILLFFLSLLLSCQTTQDPTATSGEGENGREDESAGDIVDNGGEEVEDLESEFANSEDFEKEMAEEAFPDGDVEGEASAELETAEQEEEEASPLDAEEIAKKETLNEGTLNEGSTEEEESNRETEVSDIDEDDIFEAEVSDSDVETSDIETSDSSVVINNIRYEATENQIYVEGTGNFSYQSRPNTETNQFIIEIPRATLSDALKERPFVMKDFGTEIGMLQADQKDSDTVRIVVQMRENAGMPSVSLSDSGALMITSSLEGGGGDDGGALGGGGDEAIGSVSGPGGSGILPAKSLEDFFLTTPEFTGRPISIHLKDVSVKDVLYFISEGTGLNMVIADDVSGNISIKLRNVPWDQALVTVMKTKKLGYLREGNVVRIMSLDALKKNQEEIQKILESRKDLAPLKVKVIPLVYAQASDMVSQVKEISTEKRGKVSVDKQSNSIIVIDTARVIDRMEVMIKNLDKTPLQVMIEAKIVEARESFVRNLGLNLSYEGTQLNIVPGGNPQLALDVNGGLDIFPGGLAAAGRTMASQLSVGFAPFGNLDVELGLSEAEDLIHVISAPRVMVLNGEKAKITQSTQSIDLNTTFPEGGGAPTTSPTRVTANLDFDVSPQVTALGSVFMDIKMKRDFFGPPDAATGSRPLNSREAETKVLVNNGQTIVIGGIYQKDETSSNEGLPFLRHIPILKWFFSRTTRDQNRNELLLFLTPRVSEFKKIGEESS